MLRLMCLGLDSLGLVWFGLANYAQVNVPWVGFFGAGMV